MKRWLLIGTGIVVSIFVIAFVLLWVTLARPVFPGGNVSSPISGTVKPELLKVHVTALSQKFFPRDHNHPENLNRVADYIRMSFMATGTSVEDQPFEVNGLEYRNIVASYGPDSEEIIVVGAHYDAYDEFPGADDNASAVAGLIEIGRILGANPPASRVVLVAFTLEEPPYFATDNMGSAVYAKSLKDKGITVKLMICLEMIGYYSDEPGSQLSPSPIMKLFYPSEGNFIAVVDEVFSSQGGRMKKWMKPRMDLPVYSINAPVFIPGIDFSDHRNFWRYQFPAVMVTDTAFFRNTAYHTENDTSDRLDYRKMAEVTEGVAGYVLYLSGKD